MFTGASEKLREKDWQLVASYFTVKSTDIFCSVVAFVKLNGYTLRGKQLCIFIIVFDFFFNQVNFQRKEFAL